MRALRWLFLLALTLPRIAMAQAPVATVAPAAEAPAEDAPATAFAVVVGTTRSDRPGTPTLRFSDDDAARYYEMFSLFAKHVELLTVLDDETQARHPGLADIARLPTRSGLEEALERTRKEIAGAHARGERTAFYFVFAGHGDVGENHEGYLVLQDSRFTRTDLYQKVIGPSNADLNHIIIDACRAYFMVARRGPGAGAAIREVLDAQSLDRYPNTGVLVATTDSAEVHEWARYSAGVFSHEVRSAMLGGADIAGDHRITYTEVGAFVAAANASVSDPRAKLNVTAIPPRSNRNAAVIDWRGSKASFLQIDAAGNEPFYLEDERGVRIADLYPAAGQHLEIALQPGRTIFVRGKGWEARFQTVARTAVTLASLERGAPSVSSRGSVEDSFDRGLFSVPFGSGFYQGYARANPSGTFLPPPVVSEAHSWSAVQWSSLGVTAVAGGAAIWAGNQAATDASQYRNAIGTSTQIGLDRKRTIQAQQLETAAGALFVAGVGASGYLFWPRHEATFAVAPEPGGGQAIFQVKF